MSVSKITEHKVKMSSKGQIVIPGEIREKYGYRKGTELILKPLDENRILLERVPKLSEFFGFLGNIEAAKILLKEREREVRVEKERHEELRK